MIRRNVMWLSGLAFFVLFVAGGADCDGNRPVEQSAKSGAKQVDQFFNFSKNSEKRTVEQ